MYAFTSRPGESENYPTGNLKYLLRFVEMIVVIAVGLVSLVIYPMPSSLVLVCVILGSITGALWLVRHEFSAFVGLAIFTLGIDRVGETARKLPSPWDVPWWQPTLVGASMLVMILFIGEVRRYRVQRQKPRSTG